MPSTAEIQSALEGAWLLARFDANGMRRFDLTFEGFWRSFAAALVAAPAYAILVFDQYRDAAVGSHLGAVAMVEILAYFIGWTSFPVIAIFATRLLGLADRYVPLVVANNWATVLQICLLVLALLVGGLLPDPQRALVGLIATALAATYQWTVIKIALETTGAVAFALLVIDVLVSVLINLGVSRLIQVV